MTKPMHVAAALAFAASLAAAEPFGGMQFADGKSRGMDQFHGESVVLVNFCAH
jgi:hypothetical protein